MSDRGKESDTSDINLLAACLIERNCFHMDRSEPLCSKRSEAFREGWLRSSSRIDDPQSNHSKVPQC